VFLLFFGISAFVTAVLAAIGFSFPLQIAVFAILALASGFLIRPALMRRLADKTDTNAASMVGKKVEVLESIKGPDQPGIVKVWGEHWRAVADQPAEAGALVEVIAVESTVLRVKKTD
jgi:membrane protein implicated in regulation of membrane protease activity